MITLSSEKPLAESFNDFHKSLNEKLLIYTFPLLLQKKGHIADRYIQNSGTISKPTLKFNSAYTGMAQIKTSAKTVFHSLNVFHCLSDPFFQSSFAKLR